MKIEVTIEPSWTTDHKTMIVEIPDGELEGMTDGQQQEWLQTYAAEAVNNACPWGWEEVSEDTPVTGG
jgi:hypothetical protein